MRQDLFTAIAAGDTAAVESLLTQDRKLAKQKSSAGEPALIEAVKAGHTDIARLLLDAGAKVDQQGKSYRMIPAEWAILMGRVELLQLLLDRGQDPNATNAKKVKLLDVALQGDLAMVKLLVSRGAKASADALVRLIEGAAYQLEKDPKSARRRIELLLAAGAKINAVNRSKATALHAAIVEGETSVAKLLIDLGADLNLADKNGFTPLHMAAGLGKVGCVRALLKAGADTTRKDRNKETAAKAALDGGQLFSHELLSGGKKAPASPDELNDAILRNDIRDIKTMMSRNPAMKTMMLPIGVTGMYPLHLACLRANGQTVKSLIGLGCDVNAKCGQFESFPLYEAAQGDNVAAIRVLVAAGADIHQVRDETKTALFGAVEFWRVEAVRALLELGAAATGLITRVAENEAKPSHTHSIFDTPEGIEKENATRRQIADLVKAAYEKQRVR